MGRKILIVCHTYNMLFAAIQLKRYDLFNDKVDIIISDYSNGMNLFSAKLKELNLFHEVHYVKLKDKYHGGNTLKKVRKTLYIFEKEENVKILLGLDDFKYDDFYFCNFEILSNQIYRIILKNNPNAVFHRFEEGYSTYTIKDDYRILNFIMKLVCKVEGIKTLNKKTKYIHLFEPDFLVYACNYEKRKIKKIDKNDKETIDIYNYIFNYNSQAKEYEGKKYIFFEESFCVDKKQKINDDKLIIAISKMVGKENFIVKLHPRNGVNRFEQEGISVAESNLPWEIIQLNGEFSQTCFLTISSGSVLPTKTWFGDNNKIYMLYNCTNCLPRMVNANYKIYLNRIMEKYGSTGFEILEDINSLIEVLNP